MLVYQRVLFIGQIQLLMDNAWRIVISYGDFIPNTMGYVYNHQKHDIIHGGHCIPTMVG